MFQSYLTKNKEAKEQLQDQAINEMQHMGWLGEELIGIGGSPKMEHTEVNLPDKTADMMQTDIEIEKKVADTYDKAAKETDNPKLRELFKRLRDHELYHVEVFDEILKEEGG